MGLEILINGEKVYETPGDALLSQEMTIADQYGEHAMVRIPNDVSRVLITLTHRDPLDANNPLDVRENDARFAAASVIEARGAELVDEGRDQVQEFETNRLLYSGDFPRDENGNPIRSDGQGGTEILLDVAEELKKRNEGQQNSNETETSVETEVAPNELGTPQLVLSGTNSGTMETPSAEESPASGANQ